MPHIDIKCFPRELDSQQQAALAQILPTSSFAIWAVKKAQ